MVEIKSVVMARLDLNMFYWVKHDNAKILIFILGLELDNRH